MSTVRRARCVGWEAAVLDDLAKLAELMSIASKVPSAVDVDQVRDVADCLAMSDALDAPARGQLERALGGPGATDTGADRLMRTFGALFGAGDYIGAALVARRLAARANPRLVLLGTNLATLCELHDGSMDDPLVAGSEVARLRYLASLPESETLERSSPLASPAATLREIVAHQIGVGGSANAGVAALAAEALCDARVSRLTARATQSFLDRLTQMATTTRGSVAYPEMAPSSGVRVHVVELVLTADQAVVAVVETYAGGSVGRLCSFFGTELRMLTKLVSSPRHAERLTERELRRIRRCLGLGDDGIDQATVIPSARLWTLPWERIIPDARVAMCTSPPRSRPALSPRSRPRVVAVGEPGLAGSEVELGTLRTLDRTGTIELLEAQTLDEFIRLLADAMPDVAALGVHGVGESLSYRLIRGTEALPLYRLLEVQLPPLVSVASCYSGSVSGAVNLAALLTRSDTMAVVSLWDTLDAGASTVMSQLYAGFASGLRVTDAWNQTSVLAGTVGLRLIGIERLGP